MFYRVVKLNSEIIVKPINSVKSNADAIEEFARQGEPVLIMMI